MIIHVSGKSIFDRGSDSRGKAIVYRICHESNAEKISLCDSVLFMNIFSVFWNPVQQFLLDILFVMFWHRSWFLHFGVFHIIILQLNAGICNGKFIDHLEMSFVDIIIFCSRFSWYYQKRSLVLKLRKILFDFHRKILVIKHNIIILRKEL
ncbi:MAG: hypothetical protein ACD_2C00248G0001 [uncultured bacterium (gcode 4)]|uniref:Uncharacterized protein n=1 Tax=uncultured bacterium (gcode 4) TaxID=1234023 RepID=K2G1B1_9BACT|nr:MAG: hypothetical protein ACD_2C00248G0001 [uncultured bacterium (gcode 4)]